MGCYKVTYNGIEVMSESWKQPKEETPIVWILPPLSSLCVHCQVILDCSESNVSFYEKCGLVRKEVQMVRTAACKCVRTIVHKVCLLVIDHIFPLHRSNILIGEIVLGEMSLEFL